MIDSLVNLVFRCSHQRLTRPVTPVSRPGQPAEESTYVACLECGKHFAYDPVEMRIGKAVQPGRGVNNGKASIGWRLKRALLAALPFLVLLGSRFRRTPKKPQPRM